MLVPEDCLLQTCFYVLCWCIPSWECNIARVITLRNASRPTSKATGCEILLYVVLYSARKNRLVMTSYSFLGHEYCFFNAIVSGLIALNTLKSQKKGLCPLKPHQGSTLDPNYDSDYHFFPYKTQSSSTKQTLVKVIG